MSATSAFGYGVCVPPSKRAFVIDRPPLTIAAGASSFPSLPAPAAGLAASRSIRNNDTVRSFFWALSDEDFAFVAVLAESTNKAATKEEAKGSCFLCGEKVKQSLLHEHIEDCLLISGNSAEGSEDRAWEGVIAVEDADDDVDQHEEGGFDEEESTDEATFAAAILGAIRSEFPEAFESCLRFLDDGSPRLYRTGPSSDGLVPVSVPDGTKPPTLKKDEQADDETILGQLCLGKLPRAKGAVARPLMKAAATGSPSAAVPSEVTKLASQLQNAFRTNASAASSSAVFSAKDAGKAALLSASMEGDDGGSGAAVSQAALDVLASLACICGTRANYHTPLCNQQKYDAAREKADALREQRQLLIQKMAAFGKGKAKARLADGSVVDISGGEALGGEAKRQFGGAIRAHYLDQARALESRIKAAEKAASHALFLAQNKGTVNITSSGPAITGKPPSILVGMPPLGPIVGGKATTPKSSSSSSSSGSSPAASSGSYWSSNAAASARPAGVAESGSSSSSAAASAGFLTLVDDDNFGGGAKGGIGCSGRSYQLDLHLQRADEAVALLRSILPSACALRARSLRIITGLGKHSSPLPSPSAGFSSAAPMKQAVAAFLRGVEGERIKSSDGSGLALRVRQVRPLPSVSTGGSPGFEVIFE